ncbi:hypothetical protein GE09DRAFT_1262991 [Coniochaeta sp. 2T2.1]|nr:hypothetical protein GE09DRAFT_1262991 [Coniochaeta sp. 2T2.1]
MASISAGSVWSRLPSASHQFLRANRVAPACESGWLDGLKVGDVLLTINGTSVTKYSDLDSMHWKGWKSREAPVPQVVRNRAELSITLPTFAADDLETDHVVYALDAVAQKPPHAVRLRVSSLPSNVFISAVTIGSPAALYSRSNLFVAHINKKPTTDLDSFVDALTRIGRDE